MTSSAMTRLRAAVRGVGAVLALVALVGVVPDRVHAQDTRKHVVASGETLFRISRIYGVTVDDLRRANSLSGDGIQVGQVLLIPNAATKPETTTPAQVDAVPERPDAVHADSIVSVETAAEETDATGSPALAWIDAAPGQSLYDLAFAVGLSADSLSRLNPALPTFFSPGDGVRVPKALATVMHGVRRGDTLFKIAREYGTSIQELRRANGLVTDVIHVGQVIMVPATRTAAGEPFALPAAGRGVARQYPSRFAGRLMAGGREYDPEAYTISHGDLPIGSLVLLTNDEGDETFAEVADRLPASAGYMIDVSKAVADALTLSGSNPEVEVSVVRFGSSTR